MTYVHENGVEEVPAFRYRVGQTVQVLYRGLTPRWLAGTIIEIDPERSDPYHVDVMNNPDEDRNTLQSFWCVQGDIQAEEQSGQ
jgi:hypothetical protein